MYMDTSTIEGIQLSVVISGYIPPPSPDALVSFHLVASPHSSNAGQPGARLSFATTLDADLIITTVDMVVAGISIPRPGCPPSELSGPAEQPAHTVRRKKNRRGIIPSLVWPSPSMDACGC